MPQFTSAVRVNAAQAVVGIAQTKIGLPFRMGREGPQIFDCSGLVYYIYQRLGLYEQRFGTRRFLARDYYSWGRQRGKLSRSNPEVGDLILWTDPRTERIVHMGIYVGGAANGRPMAISALTTGVRRHGLTGIHVRFLTYVHMNLDGQVTDDDNDDDGPNDPQPNDPRPTDNGGAAKYRHVGQYLDVGRNLVPEHKQTGPVLAR